jgi:hypothetical protein
MRMEASDLQAYDDWLADHMEELYAAYSGKVIAIHQGQVVNVGNSEIEVYRWVRDANLQPRPLVFRVPTEADLNLVL